MNFTRMWRMHIPRQGRALLLVVGLAIALADDAAADSDDRVTDMQVSVGDQVIEIYVARDDNWQLVSWQSTQVP